MSTARKNDSAPLNLFTIAESGEFLIIRFAGVVYAGFPSPADDFFSVPVDLKSELMPHPDASYFIRVLGDSMQDARIDDGDLLIVDRSLRPWSGCIAICVLNGGFTVKHLEICGKSVRLLPANPALQPVDLVEGDELTVWGVVTYIVKKAGHGRTP